jgi:hypothetical protein
MPPKKAKCVCVRVCCGSFLSRLEVLAHAYLVVSLVSPLYPRAFCLCLLACMRACVHALRSVPFRSQMERRSLTIPSQNPGPGLNHHHNNNRRSASNSGSTTASSTTTKTAIVVAVSAPAAAGTAAPPLHSSPSDLDLDLGAPEYRLVPTLTDEYASHLS